ncbi:hypothetical protein pb186bvf_019966 [Paramecium bursaria]
MSQYPKFRVSIWNSQIRSQPLLLKRNYLAIQEIKFRLHCFKLQYEICLQPIYPHITLYVGLTYYINTFLLNLQLFLYYIGMHNTQLPMQDAQTQLFIYEQQVLIILIYIKIILYAQSPFYKFYQILSHIKLICQSIKGNLKTSF